jgi:hypothetical protein
VARSLPDEEKARVLAMVMDPGESLAAALVVALHLGSRRGLLVAFLDALGLPHEGGILKEDVDAAPPANRDAARKAVATLAAFPREQVRTYLNALWLQDPERWGVLDEAPGWLEEP